MKTRFFILLILWAVGIPAAASGIIMCVWNGIMPQLAGLSAIGFGQAAGIFLLCQLLSGGFVFGLLLLAAGIHIIGFHKNHEAHERWMKMSEEERREVFRRRMARFGYRERENDKTDKQADGNDDLG